jgi:hypothetical protein
MWDKRLADLERLVGDKHPMQAVQEAGAVLEELLPEVCRRTVHALPPPSKKETPGAVRTAMFDGTFFDAANGKAIPGETFHARTPWGWIA